MGVSFSCVKNWITAHCSMCFVMVEKELSILHLAQHKSLCLPSHSAWQKEAQGKMNTLQKVLLQDHRSRSWDTCKEALPSKHPTTYLSKGKGKVFPVHAIKVSEGTDVQLHSLLMLTKDACEWAISHPGCFTHGKEPQ